MLRILAMDVSGSADGFQIVTHPLWKIAASTPAVFTSVLDVLGQQAQS